MKTITEILSRNDQVSGYKINIHKKESYELFFVKGKLETLRCTDTCDKQVTVYVTDGETIGDAQFFVYPSTTESQLEELIQNAVSQAKMIHNRSYNLPGAETGEYSVESNLGKFDPSELAAKIAEAVFGANTEENCAINSLEIFVNRHTETVANSRGLNKTQIRYDAMVEAIPTYNGETQSVELYELIRFGSLDADALSRQIAEKMEEVKARYHATTPEAPISAKVILHPQELSELFINFAGDLHYSTVYSHSNLYKIGDAIQNNPAGDRIGITMAGEAPGCVHSSKFDSDGMTLIPVRLIENGTVIHYYGSNRYGQYLNEQPTGELRCMLLDPGTAEETQFQNGPYLDVKSMSGLQVDFYSDYIGGEIRLAYYHDGEKCKPVTGISISGKLSEVLEHIHFSRTTTVCGGYCGPDKAILTGMQIF